MNLIMFHLGSSRLISIGIDDGCWFSKALAGAWWMRPWTRSWRRQVHGLKTRLQKKPEMFEGQCGNYFWAMMYDMVLVCLSDVVWWNLDLIWCNLVSCSLIICRDKNIFWEFFEESDDFKPGTDGGTEEEGLGKLERVETDIKDTCWNNPDKDMLSNFRCVPLPFWKFWSLTAQLRSRRAVSGHLISRPQEVGALHFADTLSTIALAHGTNTQGCCAATCWFWIHLRLNQRSDLLFFCWGTTWADQCCRSWPGAFSCMSARARLSDDWKILLIIIKS